VAADPISSAECASTPFAPGAYVDSSGVAHFCVWVPDAQRVDVVIQDAVEKTLAMTRASSGYFVLDTREVGVGGLYRYRIDGKGPWPDPCSRYQPEGPHGPSQLVAPHRYEWRDTNWKGLKLHGQVIYELHVGTFTAEGTFDAAIERLTWLKEIGITLIEILPVAEFPGRWGWGYDGVQLYAPFHHYGDHEAFKRFVDAAHAIGLGVILDVVYNHLGPDGNYLRCFSDHYFSSRHKTEWGEALNFDGENCEGARDLIVDNACYWIREFHLDGFRLDATQAIQDDSTHHVLEEMVQKARAEAGSRDIVFIAEDEPQRSEHLLPARKGGWGIDAMWNDDFHHSAAVALTGSRDAYFHDYTGRAQELVSAIKRGFLYQGQHYHWQKKPRGSPLRGVPAQACVHFLQNHDQVGNTYASQRIHQLSHPGRHRALTALFLLGPQTPMLFMGQEFHSSSPFHYFIDHNAELSKLVWTGRREFLAQFRGYQSQAAKEKIPDPAAESTFRRSKLDWSEVERNPHILELHRDLLRLRREDPVVAAQDVSRIDGATLAEHAFILHWFDEAQGDRILLVNLQQDLPLDPAPEPLLAPPLDQQWELLWSSEEPKYGGVGTYLPVDEQQRWRIPGNSAMFMRSIAR
jgi:maltooligosyltrehalose trehalohydrolase